MRRAGAVAGVALLVATGCTSPHTVAPSPASTAPVDSTGATSTPPRAVVDGCPTGPGSTRLTIASTALGHTIRMTIITAVPPDEVGRVLYLLHGANTDETQWADIGVQQALDDTVANGDAPIGLLLPDLPNSYDLGLDSTALIDDVIPAAEACLSRIKDRSQRAVGGISRGGQLALAVAAAHPELFGVVGGHSPVVDVAHQRQLAHDLATSDLRVWLDVGEDDALRPATVSLAQALTALGASPELTVSPGRHDRSYWAAHLHDYLNWYQQELAA